MVVLRGIFHRALQLYEEESGEAASEDAALVSYLVLTRRRPDQSKMAAYCAALPVEHPDLPVFWPLLKRCVPLLARGTTRCEGEHFFWFLKQLIPAGLPNRRKKVHPRELAPLTGACLRTNRCVSTCIIRRRELLSRSVEERVEAEMEEVEQAFMQCEALLALSQSLPDEQVLSTTRKLHGQTSGDAGQAALSWAEFEWAWSQVNLAIPSLC